ncbi:nucleoside-diphosphate kinase [candidate division KSB1 bacterium]|nr:nucleoside-diphosphate kinase [candidate division KSB1 bacterium]
MKQTLAILKPDCLQRNLVGKVIDRIEENGFEISGMKMIKMTKEQAEGFYAVHQGKPFFAELVEFMTESPVVVAALRKENAVQAWRDLMGATNPENAAPGTLRKEYAESIGRNTVHGSDSDANATREIAFFFSESDLILTQKG